VCGRGSSREANVKYNALVDEYMREWNALERDKLEDGTLRDRGRPIGATEEQRAIVFFEDIDHSRTKTKSPQTNGICERFHKPVLNEFYRVAFRKKVYRSIDELQADLSVGPRCSRYNVERLRERLPVPNTSCSSFALGWNFRTQ
jgi:hypothetical protein